MDKFKEDDNRIFEEYNKKENFLWSSEDIKKYAKFKFFFFICCLIMNVLFLKLSVFNIGKISLADIIFSTVITLCIFLWFTNSYYEKIEHKYFSVWLSKITNEKNLQNNMGIEQKE